MSKLSNLIANVLAFETSKEASRLLQDKHDTEHLLARHPGRTVTTSTDETREFIRQERVVHRELRRLARTLAKEAGRLARDLEAQKQRNEHAAARMQRLEQEIDGLEKSNEEAEERAPRARPHALLRMLNRWRGFASFSVEVR